MCDLAKIPVLTRRAVDLREYTTLKWEMCFDILEKTYVLHSCYCNAVLRSPQLYLYVPKRSFIPERNKKV